MRFLSLSFRGARRASPELIRPYALSRHGFRVRSLARPPRNDDTERANSMSDRSKQDLRRHRRLLAIDRIRALFERGGEPRKRRVEDRAHQHRQHPALELIGDEESDLAAAVCLSISLGLEAPTIFERRERPVD